MKQSYTTYHSRLKVLAKQHGVGWEEILKKTQANKLRLAGEINPEWEKVSMLDSLAIEGKIHAGAALHLFMPDLAFCNWLVSCVPFLEVDHAKVLQQMIGLKTVGVLHFPTSSKRTSMGFFIPEKTYTTNHKIGSDFGLLAMVFSNGNLENLDIGTIPLGEDEPEDDNLRWPPEVMWYPKLVIGLGMYVSCFPDMLKNGPPQDLKHPSHHQYAAPKTIAIAPKLRTTDGPTGHDSPIAHYRNAHFRFLKSERYSAEKRFTTILIMETFVKGKSKTVLSPEESP